MVKMGGWAVVDLRTTSSCGPLARELRYLQHWFWWISTLTNFMEGKPAVSR